MKNLLIILFSISFVAVTAQKKIKTPKNAIQDLERFKEQPKFDEDFMLDYPGISDEVYRPELTSLINLSADDFIEIASKTTPTAKDYQEKIKEGLQRFSTVYPDLKTSDIERIASYYEELMTIVNLNSSNGYISKFRRGIGFERN
tara:strand:- start:37541 stop:37975 length:435 start_codon:yes stop_codon:yes gene_type:complete